MNSACNEAGSVLGMMGRGFALWLNLEIERLKPDRIVFLSREGWFLGRIWQTVNSGHSREVAFVRASRHVLSLATSTDEEAMFAALDQPCADCSLASFIQQRIAVTLEESDTQIVRKAGFSSINEVINRRLAREPLRRLALFLKERHFSAARRMRENARSYYQEFGLHRGRSLIVDIGYNGTSRRAFSNLFSEAQFDGRFLCTFHGAKGDPSSRGWLLNNENNKTRSHPFTRNVAMAEFLMMHPSGTLIDFADCEGRIQPVLAPDEPSETCAVLEEISERAIETVLNFKNIPDNIGNGVQSASGFLKFLDSPRNEVIEVFRQLYLEDSYGGCVRRFLVPPIPQGGFPTLTSEERYIRSAAWGGAARALAHERRTPLQSVVWPILQTIRNRRRRYRILRISREPA